MSFICCLFDSIIQSLQHIFKQLMIHDICNIEAMLTFHFRGRRGSMVISWINNYL